MDNLARLFGKFVARDLLYIVGGAPIVFIIAHAFYPELFASNSVLSGYNGIAIMISLGVLSHAIGWAIKDGLALAFPAIFTSSLQTDTSKLTRILFRRFTGSEVLILSKDEIDAARIYIENSGKRDIIEQIERTITLHHVGMTIGSCSIVTSLTVLVLWFVGQIVVNSIYALLVIAFISILLIVLGNIKLLQAIQQIVKASKQLRDSQKIVPD